MSGRFFSLTTVLALCFLACSPVATAEDDDRVLHVYTWEDYFSPEAVRLFEEKYDCVVDFTYYESNETMFETLHDGGGYDVITPSGNAATALFNEGYLLRLDHSRLPNLRYIDTASRAMALDPEMVYSVVYTVTVTGVGYNTRLVPPDAPGTWDMFSDPRLRKSMSMLNDMRETLGAALREFGFSLNTTNPDEVVRAGKLLGMWKRNIARFEVVGAIEALDNGTLLAAQAYNGDIARLMQTNQDIGFFVPSTGSALNLDAFVIPADSEHPDLAHAFINHFCDPDIAAINMEHTCYNQPNPTAFKKLPQSLLDNAAFAISNDILENCELIRNLGDDRELYDAVWADVLLNE
ncbi:MAG: spermidine/putrescine ABC transporter substrate-binding protein [Planctomycetes bacterium]|nr:spermidine/putrescine ABC transporter substrate-binding protein [Planctomycetota bacterium]MCD7896805.1 spermidine/putrescine ABC transporter substrate-binding protein [Planctomycetaceae bacterium]